MAIKIVWSPEADETFARNIDYLCQEWSDKEVEKFILQTGQVIKRLLIFPESYHRGTKNKKYRKARLNKYTVLFYHYSKTQKVITLVTFWNVKQDPKKLKY